LVSDRLIAVRDTTTQMSATKQPMLSSTHTIFLGIQSHLIKELAKLPATADPVLRQGLVKAHVKLSDYFTKFDKSRYYSWATCLIFLLLSLLSRSDRQLISAESSDILQQS
jgi:hypothetical protein